MLWLHNGEYIDPYSRLTLGGVDAKRLRGGSHITPQEKACLRQRLHMAYTQICERYAAEPHILYLKS